MATRFYLQSDNPGASTPAYDAGWNKTSDATRLRLVQARDASAFATVTGAQITSGPNNILLRQFISSPVTAQTISGTVKGQIRAIESNAALNATVAVSLKVVSGDGSTSRGSLLALTASTNTATPPEMATALTNRGMQDSSDNKSITLSSVAAQDGDRIVLEIGYRENNTTTNTTQTGGLSFGDSSASDLAENDTATTADNTWIEFSGTITPKSISSLTDDFSSLDATIRWTNWGGVSVASVSNQLQISNGISDTAYHGLDSKDRWSMVGARVSCKVVDVGNQALVSWEVYPVYVVKTSGDELFMLISGGSILCFKKVAAASTQVATATYSSSTHVYFAIREAGGTTYWEYSTDGLTFTTIYSEANPITLSSIYTVLQAGTWQNEVSATSATFDSYNLLPSPAAGGAAVAFFEFI